MSLAQLPHPPLGPGPSPVPAPTAANLQAAAPRVRSRAIARSLPLLGAAFVALALITASAAATTLESRVSASANDAEEFANLSVHLNSSDLELIHDSSDQIVGMRWAGLAIPPGSTITAAWIQFGADESQSVVTNLTFRGQAADSAASFTTNARDISLRPRTTAATSWSPVAWTLGQAGADQRTPDLSAVIQEIVSRQGWKSGNALAVIVNGTGHRTAYAYDGNRTLAPLLHIEYTAGPPPDFPPVASLSVTQLASPPLTVTASGAASTDGDATPIASYRFDFGDGTPAVTTTAPTATATHTYADVGTYTITLIVTDTGGNASAPVSSSFTVNPPPADQPPVAALSVSQVASPPLTVSASGAGSTDTDTTPIATYEFNFGDGTAAVTTTAPTASTTHTYAAAGTYTVTLIVTDTGFNSSTPRTASITVVAGGSATFEKRTAASTDDAEESSGGAMYLNSSDLELVYDGSNQTVGMRWTGVTIPAGSTITNAWIQFGAKESQSEVTNLTFQGQAADNPATFGLTSRDISLRPRTAGAVVWSPVAWNVGEAGANQRTPNLSDVIREIVSRPGWASGNALAIVVTGTGHRTPWSWDGNSAQAPLLHVEYSTGPVPEAPPVARLSVSQLASPALTVTASGAASTDGDATPIASYRFDFGDGTPAVTTTAPTSSANHTYAAAGTYTVALTVTDTKPSTSAPATASITVVNASSSPLAVYTGYYDTHHPDNLKPKPDPWMGSAGVTFVGTPDSPSGGWDSSCLRLDNLSGGSLTVTVTVDIGSNHYALWGSRSIPAGGKLILAQTGFENFDGSDTNPAGCYGCDPRECLTKIQSTVPIVHVTLGGTTTNYYDTGQILNTHGVDAAGCPATGGRNDESESWQRIYPSGAGEVPAASDAGISRPGTDRVRSSWLALPYPNPARTEVVLRFATAVRGQVQLAVYDVSGRLVRMCANRVLEPGEYLNGVDMRGTAPGMYFCVLRTPEGSLRQAFVFTP